MRGRRRSDAAGDVVISLVTTVHGDGEALRRTSRSLRRQRGVTWEWVRVGPGQSREAAENEAICRARGTFVGFLDEGHTLEPDALAALAAVIRDHPGVDIVYTDEDRVDRRGYRFDPFLKPDWSPERLLCHDYFGDLTLMRASRVRSLGGIREGFGSARRHDLFLRLTDDAADVRHVRRILHHAPGSPPSVDGGGAEQEPDAHRRAIEETCRRRGIDAEVVPTGEGVHIVRRRPVSRPSVSVVIPTRGSAKPLFGLESPMIENLLRSALALADREDMEWVVVYDTVMDPALLSRLGALSPRVRPVAYDEPFSFARKCNVGAREARGDVLVFLNDDMEAITPEWVDRLAAHLEDEGVGAVGAMLLLESGLVQSAGHRDTPTGPVNLARGRSPDSPRGRGQEMRVTREVTGITGACIAMRRRTFADVGGFDESYPGNFNDVDLCYRITDRGLRILWTPDVRFFHFESQTRGILVEPGEREHLNRQWGHRYARDDLDPYVRELSMDAGGSSR